MLQEFLNIKRVASYLDLKRSTLYSLVEQRLIPHYRVGRQIRFKKSDVDAWMEKQRKGVVNVKVEARRVIRSVEKEGDLDVSAVMKKTIDDVRGRRYTSRYGKPDQVSDLRKEARDGNV